MAKATRCTTIYKSLYRWQILTSLSVCYWKLQLVNAHLKFNCRSQDARQIEWYKGYKRGKKTSEVPIFIRVDRPVSDSQCQITNGRHGRLCHCCQDVTMWPSQINEWQNCASDQVQSEGHDFIRCTRHSLMCSAMAWRIILTAYSIHCPKQQQKVIMIIYKLHPTFLFSTLPTTWLLDMSATRESRQEGRQEGEGLEKDHSCQHQDVGQKAREMLTMCMPQPSSCLPGNSGSRHGCQHWDANGRRGRSLLLV